MKHRGKHIAFWAGTFLLMVSFFTAFGQDSRHLVFLRSVPQSFKLNPANEVPYGFWIGFPGLSSWSVSVENSGFTYHDIFYRTPDDSLRISIDGFLNALQESNYISSNLQAEVLAFGFHVRETYIDFRFTDRIASNINYSRDFMSFLLKGNGQFINKTASFSGTGFNLNCFHEISLGFSTMPRPNIRAGVRLKLLGGIANISSKKTDITLFTNEELAYAMTVNSNIEINTSIPGLNNDSLEDKLDFDVDEDDALNALKEFRNPGYAMDLGLEYQMNERWLFGFSMLDLGFIHWKNNPRNYISDKNKHQFTFEGIDLSSIDDHDSTIFREQIEMVLDTLEENLGINTTRSAYTGYLVPQLNVTAEYSPDQRNHFGLLFRGEIFNDKLFPTLLINYNVEVGRFFTLMAGYHLNKNNYRNIALGYSFKVAGLELYMITDNAYAFYDPSLSKLVHFQFGVNFCFTDKRFRQ